MTQSRPRRLARHTGLALMLAGVQVPTAPTLAAKALHLSDILTLCGRSRGDACQAYVEGVADGSRIVNAAVLQQPLFCLPDAVTRPELAATVMGMAEEDIREQPDDGKLLAAAYISAALVLRFPCAATAERNGPAGSPADGSEPGATLPR